MTRISSCLLGLAAAAVLASCSGGGGGGSSPAAAAAPPAADDAATQQPEPIARESPAADEPITQFVIIRLNSINYPPAQNFYPTKLFWDLIQDAREAKITGRGAIIGIYDDGNLIGVRPVIEKVHGDEVFAPTPYRGFEYDDGEEPRVRENKIHGLIVTLTSLALAPRARISYQNTRLSDSSVKPPLVSATALIQWLSTTRTIYVWEDFLGRNPKPDVLNMSFGGYAPLNKYTSDELRQIADGGGDASKRRRINELVSVFLQSGASQKSVFAFAGGNRRLDKEGGENHVSILYASLPAVFPQLEEIWLAVIALDSDGNLASYSQKCGGAANWCLAAPGNSYASRGTSFATPIVSGAFALAVEKFTNPDGSRALSNVQIRRRILDTADKSDKYADADTYGQGALSVANLLQPFGERFLVTEGYSLNAPHRAFGLDDSRLTASPSGALGDGVTMALRGRSIAAFDQLGAPFFYPLDSFVSNVSARSAIDRFMDEGGFAITDKLAGAAYNWLGREANSFLWRGKNSAFSTNLDPGLQLGLYGEGLLSPDQFVATPFSSPYLSLTQHNYSLGSAASHAFSLGGSHKLRLAAFHRGNDQRFGNHGGSGLVGEHIYRRGDTALALQGGLVNEKSRQLGSRGYGAFSTAGGADTYFGGVAAHRSFGGLRLMASAYAGVSDMDTPLMRLGRVLSSSFSLGAQLDDWSLAAHQPLRAERADGSLSYAEGRYPDGRLRMVERDVSLTPSGRELTAELRRGINVGGGVLNVAAIARRQPGHDRDAAAALEGLLHFGKRF